MDCYKDRRLHANCQEVCGARAQAYCLLQDTSTHTHATPTIATNNCPGTSFQRFVAYAKHPDYGEMKLSKGLLDKVRSHTQPQPLTCTPAPTPAHKILDTGDDGGDMWICEDLAKLEPEIKQVDAEFSKNGFKVHQQHLCKHTKDFQSACPSHSCNILLAPVNLPHSLTNSLPGH